MAEHGRSVPLAQDSPALASHIRYRLSIGFLITLLTAAFSIVVGLFDYLTTDRAYSEVLAQTTMIEDRVSQLNDAIVAEVLHTRAYLLTGDEQSITQRDLSKQDFQRAYEILSTQLDQLPQSAASILPRLMSLHANYDMLAEEMIALRRSGQVEEAVKLFSERSDPLVLRLLSTRQALASDIDAFLAQASQSYSVRTRQTIILVVMTFLLEPVMDL